MMISARLASRLPAYWLPAVAALSMSVGAGLLGLGSGAVAGVGLAIFALATLAAGLGLSRRVAVARRLAERVTADDSALMQRMRAVESIAGEHHALMERVRAVESAAGSAAQGVESLVRRVQAVEQSVDVNRRLAGAGVGGHDRDIDPASAGELVEYWNPLLGTTATVSSVLHLAHRVRLLEGLAVGRLATHSRDLVIRSLAAEAVSGGRTEICEIGTLFGIGGLLVRDVAAGLSDDSVLSVIDPLSGYYGADRRDPPTQLPVTRAILEHNARLFGVLPEELRILEGLSTDPAIRAEAADRLYHLLIIDGDHSYEGIRADFELYAELVEPGGLLVIDDYATNNWPDVGRYTDEVIRADSRFEFVGSQSRTALFRRN